MAHERAQRDINRDLDGRRHARSGHDLDNWDLDNDREQGGQDAGA